MGGAIIPPEWLISQVCEAFNIPPSQALKEDVELVLAIMDLRYYAKVREAVYAEDIDEEAMAKMGLSDETISEVMANIERLREWR